jgi:hypothetical protein
MLVYNRDSLKAAGVVYRNDNVRDASALKGNFLRLVLLLTSIVPDGFDARVLGADIAKHINTHLKGIHDSVK